MAFAEGLILNRFVSQPNQLVFGEEKVGREELRRSDFFKTGWTHEAVFHYLTTKTRERMQELMKLTGSST
jgi:hypothetical protein